MSRLVMKTLPNGTILGMKVVNGNMEPYVTGATATGLAGIAVSQTAQNSVSLSQPVGSANIAIPASTVGDLQLTFSLDPNVSFAQVNIMNFSSAAQSITIISTVPLAGVMQAEDGSYHFHIAGITPTGITTINMATTATSGIVTYFSGSGNGSGG